MRTVAKFQFTTPSTGDETARGIGAVLDKWAERKFEIASDGGAVIRWSGLSAAFDKSSETVGDRRRDTFVVIEPVDGGNLQTNVEVVASAERTAFRCVLSIGSDTGISPANVPLRSPKFIHDIVALPASWTIGVSDERVFAQSFSVETWDVPQLEALVFAPERRLPVVVVSELNGETLAGDLHERLSQDLCGIAHTVRLTHDATFELTKTRGREWSCYNGAVRLFWPYRPRNDDFRIHPLWTYDQILSRANSEVQARDRFRGAIASRIIEASTFVADDSAFAEFDNLKSRKAMDAARAAAEGDGDIHALADLYASENDKLRLRVEEQTTEIKILRENIEALNIALRSPEAQVADAAVETPPETIAEAVAAARDELMGRIIIARETDADVSDLNPSAGPPDKILRYLRTLAELSDAIGSNEVGQSIPSWLKEHGVECSVESETSKGNRESRQFRTRSIDGESVECEFHAKPAEGVSPDRCVRIYFATGASRPFIRVGYIGRHST